MTLQVSAPTRRHLRCPNRNAACSPDQNRTDQNRTDQSWAQLWSCRDKTTLSATRPQTLAATTEGTVPGETGWVGEEREVVEAWEGGGGGRKEEVEEMGEGEEVGY